MIALQSIVPRWVIILIILFSTFLLIPVRQKLMAPWEVIVQTEKGEGVAHVHIGQIWDAYSFVLSDGRDTYTDSNGSAFFPAVEERRPVVYWISRLMLNLAVGVHSSWGTSAYVTIGAKTLGPSMLSCAGPECNTAPIHSLVQLVH